VQNRPLVRLANAKTQAEMEIEWDKIAQLRHEQISNGRDLSYRYILMPSIKRMLTGCDCTRVLDLGCGTGELTKELSEISAEVVAIDPSPRSIEIARQVCSKSRNVSFHTTMVETFAQEWTGKRFTIAVANMVLMNSLDLHFLIRAVGRLLNEGGLLVVTVTHPWFWPQYWGYADADWFCYEREIIVEAPFAISKEMTNRVTTHVHRPLFTYTRALNEAGFNIDFLDEPMPDPEIRALYPMPWDFPRFLAFRCRYLGEQAC